jgi:hypothetical protein
MTTFSEGAGRQARASSRTPEQRRAEMLDAQQFDRIKEFVAACRRQWPGAVIVLRPDGVPMGANAPFNLKTAPGAKKHD